MKFIHIFILIFFSSCAGVAENNTTSKASTVNGKQSKKEKNQQAEQTFATDTFTNKECDSAKWTYVYNPERLHVLQACKTVTGTIKERDSNEDGDEHMLLKLDKGQGDLLKKKNFSKKAGCLVIEAVCVNKPSAKKAKQTCKGYVNNVLLPKVGDHVEVTGSYVVDTHNGWTEIHPITSIRKIK